MKENSIRSLPGIPTLLVLLVVIAVAGWLCLGAVNPDTATFVASIIVGAIALVCVFGLYMVEPNQSAVISLFGKYVGTVKENGLRWNNPFFAKNEDQPARA